MADTPQHTRPPEFTGDRNLHYVIEQAGQAIADLVLDETTGDHKTERVKLARLVLGVATYAHDVMAVAIAKRWDNPAFEWVDITDAQIKTHMENAWTSCARGKFETDS